MIIDWYSLTVNALWIFAFALALAAFSTAAWQSVEQGEKLGNVLKTTSYRRIIDLAGILISISGMFTAPTLWQKLAWLALGIGFGFTIFRNVLRSGSLPGK